MNLIERQNERQSLEIQASARLVNNKAQRYDLIEWGIILLLPVLKIFFVESSSLDSIMIAWFFASFYFDYSIDHNTSLGAELKKSFDYYVYGWSDQIPSNLIRFSNEKKVKHKPFFNQQVTNSGTDKPGGVKDWYTSVKRNMSREEAIKAAMNENIYFDKKINNVALILVISFLVLIVIVVSFYKLPFNEVLVWCFITFSTLTKKTCTTLKNLKKLSKINDSIEKLLDSENVNLLFLQSEIDKKRLIPHTSNFIIYCFQTKRSHEEISYLNSQD